MDQHKQLASSEESESSGSGSGNSSGGDGPPGDSQVPSSGNSPDLSTEGSADNSNETKTAGESGEFN